MMKREEQTRTRLKISNAPIKQTGDHVITPIGHRMKQQAGGQIAQSRNFSSKQDVRQKVHLIFRIGLLARQS